MIKIENGYLRKGKNKLGPLNLSLPSNGMFSLKCKNILYSKLIVDVLLGTRHLSEGTYFYNGDKIDKTTKSNLSISEITLIDEIDLLSELTIKENILIFGNEDDDKIIYALKRCDVEIYEDKLEDFLNKKIMALNEELRIKISLAIRLYFGYNVLIYRKNFWNDEINKVLEDLKKDHLIITVCDNETFSNADNIILLENNKIDFVYNRNENLIKSTKNESNKKLSLKLIFKNTFNMIRGSSSKLALCFLMTSLIAGLTSSMVSFCEEDFITRQIQECENQNINFIELENTKAGFDERLRYHSSEESFKKETIQEIKNHFKTNVYYTSLLSLNYDKQNNIENNYLSVVDAIEYDSSLNLKIDNRITSKEKCKNPNNDDEIGISWYIADCLIENKFTYNNLLITTIDDLIGTKIGDKTIVNVYETEDRLFFEKNNAPHPNSSFSLFKNSFFLSSSVFIGKIDDHIKDSTSNLIVKLTDNKKLDISFIKKYDNQIFGLGNKIDVNSIVGAYMHENNLITWENIGY